MAAAAAAAAATLHSCTQTDLDVKSSDGLLLSFCSCLNLTARRKCSTGTFSVFEQVLVTGE